MTRATVITADQAAAIVAAYQAGEAMRPIARRMHVSERAVRAVVAASAVPIRVPSRRPPEPRRRMPLSEEQVERIRRVHGIEVQS